MKSANCPIEVVEDELEPEKLRTDQSMVEINHSDFNQGQSVKEVKARDSSFHRRPKKDRLN